MNCLSLPDTGGPAAGWLVAGVACVVVGWLLVRRGRPGRLSSVAVVVIAAGCLVAQPSPGQAADGCDDDDPGPTDMSHALVIKQTSVITGLAPGVAPVAITGTVTNPSLDSTYVTEVTVRVTSVTKARGAAAGDCTASDYVLLDARMSVERPLPKLTTIPFAGASIGFLNTSGNQDACKRATVELGYLSSSR